MPWQPLWAAGLGAPAGNLTHDNCSDGVQWIYHVLHDCVWDAKGIASESLGLASIVTWMIVSIPQMVKNFRNVPGIEGVSLMLILMWTLGDTANLVGGILTQQLKLQIYLAVYFVFADLILFSQFLYYNLWYKRRYKDYQPIGSSRDTANGNGAPPQAVLCITGALMLSLQGTMNIIHTFHNPYTGRFPSSIRHPAGRTLLSNNVGYHVHIFNSLEDEVGYGIGVVSSVFYTFSRLGQMWKNYKRQSTEGLSIAMFILAVLGNLTYGLSILVRQIDATYVIRHLPWLIGSLGVIFLDSSLLVQFYYYGRKDDFNKMADAPVTSPDDEINVTVEPRRTGTIN